MSHRPANRYADRLSRQWSELLGRILRGFPYRRGSPAHQRHFFRFLSKVPAVLAVSISESINILWSTPSLLSTLQENVHAIRAVLDRIDTLSISSHAASLIIHIHLRTSMPS